MNKIRGNSLSPDDEQKVLALRHYMHAHPELSNCEFGTQQKIAQMLADVGLSDFETFHGTGLYVDIVGNANTTPVNIVVRGDIDALPIQEARADLVYQSIHAGRMHACGHDVHASAAFGVVLGALASRDQYAGTVRVVFQPAEEAEPLGGRSVSTLGLLNGFDCAIGMHVYPEIPSGKFGVLSGPVTKSADEFQIVFKGKNSHAAWPELGVDAIPVACSFVNEAQKLISREGRNEDASVISIGKIHGGEATNIVCDRVVLDGTVRTRSHLARSTLHERIRELAEHIAVMHRAEVEVTITKGEPPVINNHQVAEYAKSAIAESFGTSSIVNVKPAAGADDFGFYAEKIPSLYYLVGCHDQTAGNVSHVHTPTFGVSDEDALRAAHATWAIVRKLQSVAAENEIDFERLPA